MPMEITTRLLCHKHILVDNACATSVLFTPSDRTEVDANRLLIAPAVHRLRMVDLGEYRSEGHADMAFLQERYPKRTRSNVFAENMGGNMMFAINVGGRSYRKNGRARRKNTDRTMF